MEFYDFTKLETDADVVRMRLRMRARAVELIRQMVTVRREDWHFYLTKRYLMHEPRLTDAERARMVVCFAEMERKHAKIRQDICNTIQLVRDLDNDSYGAAEALPEQ